MPSLELDAAHEVFCRRANSIGQAQNRRQPGITLTPLDTRYFRHMDPAEFANALLRQTGSLSRFPKVPPKCRSAVNRHGEHSLVKCPKRL